MIKRLVPFVLVCVLPLSAFSSGNHDRSFQPGALWLDNNGTHINAHGGGIICYDGCYYWFGEHKSEFTSSAQVGVTCYSSTNLIDWTYRGVALAVENSDSSDIAKGCVLERPKVIYNKRTKKFILWFHLELKGKGYSAARYGVAVSDKITGPYHYLRSSRVNAGRYDMNTTVKDAEFLDTLVVDHYKPWTSDWYDAVRKGMLMQRDVVGGQMARDQTVFVDDDDKAYHIYSSEDNMTLQIAELADDYESHTGRYVRVAASGMNEAPAVFKHHGVYWMITSGCTGWAPNTARLFRAASIWGPWEQLPNPCVGNHADTTFGGQSTYVLRVENTDHYILMADIWCPKHPIDARYIWLPVVFHDGVPVIEWRDKWSMDFFKNK